MFTIALCLPWCRLLEELDGVQPQRYADNLQCVSSAPEVLLAASFTIGYVCLVEQEFAPKKCVLTSTFRDIWMDMKSWIYCMMTIVGEGSMGLYICCWRVLLRLGCVGF